MNRDTNKPQHITSRNAFVKLLRSAEQVSADVHRSLSKQGLTVSQFAILEALYHLGPLCQKVLAEKILKSEGNLTTVINNLEKRNLVLRQRNERDRRFATVTLTSLGYQCIQELFPNHAEKIGQRMAALTKEEQKDLIRLCRKLHHR